MFACQQSGEHAGAAGSGSPPQLRLIKDTSAGVSRCIKAKMAAAVTRPPTRPPPHLHPASQMALMALNAHRPGRGAAEGRLRILTAIEF